MSLKHGDLVGTILPKVSIDEFTPKAGEDVDIIVVAFYLDDENPAKDLNTFIQRGYIDTLDVEVSPNTDEEGRYLVFVEMSRNETFPDKLMALLKDIENVAGPMVWEINTYLSDGRTFSKDDHELFSYIIVDPESYVPKEEFKMNDIKEGVIQFFEDSYITDLTIDGNVVTLLHDKKQIVAEVVDVGDYDVVIGRNFLAESAFGVGNSPYEAKLLQHMLGNCQVLTLGKYLCVNRGDKVVLLKNTEIIYGN